MAETKQVWISRNPELAKILLKEAKQRLKELDVVDAVIRHEGKNGR